MNVERFRDLLRDAVEGMRAQPGRLLLAMGTMATGVATLTVLFGMLAGLDRRADRLVADFGADVIAISPASGRQPRLVPDLRGLVRRSLPDMDVSGMHAFRGIPVGADRLVDVLAADAHLPRVRAWPLVSGRAMDPHDVRLAAHVCLLTRVLANELQLGVNQFISLAGLPLRIVGIVAPSGAGNTELDPRLAAGERFVVVPETLAPVWDRSYAPPAPGDDAIFVKTGSPATVAPTLAQLRNLAQGTAARGCAFTTPDTLLAGIRKLRSAISLSVGAIATLCLLLGAATLTGLMLARIRERVPEIGLRRSLGASRTDIAALCVIEALLTSIGAAVAGILPPVALLATLDPARLPVPVELSAAALAGPALIVALTAMLASLWPALVAARISPYEALRND